MSSLPILLDVGPHRQNSPPQVASGLEEVAADAGRPDAEDSGGLGGGDALQLDEIEHLPLAAGQVVERGPQYIAKLAPLGVARRVWSVGDRRFKDVLGVGRGALPGTRPKAVGRGVAGHGIQPPRKAGRFRQGVEVANHAYQHLLCYVVRIRRVAGLHQCPPADDRGDRVDEVGKRVVVVSRPHQQLPGYVECAVAQSVPRSRLGYLDTIDAESAFGVYCPTTGSGRDKPVPYGPVVHGRANLVERDLLVAENIRCAVGDRVLFDELSLSLRPDDLVEIRGPNGSGKSTLLRCLVGLHEPDAGEVRRAVDALYVGHRSGICPRMTPIENLRWLAGIRDSSADAESIGAALDRVGLGDARYHVCDSLSAGQQRRVTLARLLVAPAPLWILDEPLTALDDEGRDLVGELLAQHRGIGGAAVCATHQALPNAPGRTRTVTLGS